MTAALAATPVLVVLALMTVRHWSAAKAGSFGACLALVIGVLGFGFARDTPRGSSAVGALAGTFAEASFTSATILWIVLPALAIHQLQVSTGATERLRVALSRLTADPRLLALLIGWFFALFVEGAAGFGAPVALAAPFLVGIGYRPVDSVVIAMLGHAIGVSFGAVGTPLVPQVAATGLDGLTIARATADLHVITGWSLLVVLMLVASRAAGRPARGAIWGWTALAGMAFFAPYWLIATFVGPELPTLGGALVGAGIFVVALRTAGSDDRHATRTSFHGGVAAAAPARAVPHASGTFPPNPTGSELLRASAPYLVLIALVLVTRLVPVMRDALGAVELTWAVDGGFAGSFAPLTHPGTLLVVSFVAGAFIQGVGAQVVEAIRTTLAKLGGVAVALVAMLSLARIMVHAGMTEALAVAAAQAAGGSWPLWAPLVGVLGTFVTGSATASNVLFTDLQVATAEALDLSVVSMTAAQGYGAAVGNVACPHNIVAAGATVGLTGQEGEVLRRTLAPGIGYALLGGALLLVMLG